MTWKPKEKELTPEEAVALAKKELAPYWVGSKPLIAGVKNGNRCFVVPLDEEFKKKSWLILFADPTDFRGEASLLYLKEWHRRYNGHELNTLLIYVPPYSYLKNPDAIQKLKDKEGIDFPLVIDTDETIAASFGASQLPKIILYDKGKMSLESENGEWLKDTELKIQKFLRSTEPGLPLLLIFESPDSVGMAQDTSRIEFGNQHAKSGQKVGFSMDGKWDRDAEKVTTVDSNAVISFKSYSSRVSLIGQSMSKISEPAIVSIEVNGEPIYDSIAGEHVTLDDAGRSLVKVTFPQLYHFLVGLKKGIAADVTLRFPQANAVPVSLYGLRFGE